MMMMIVLVRQLPAPRATDARPDARPEPDVAMKRAKAAAKDDFGGESVAQNLLTFLGPLAADHCRLDKEQEAESKLRWLRC